MDTKRRGAATTVVGVVIGLAALTGCQSDGRTHEGPSVVAGATGAISEQHRGRPADRIAEEVQRARDAGAAPSPGCVHHRLVNYPDDDYRLVCTQWRESGATVGIPRRTPMNR